MYWKQKLSISLYCSTKIIFKTTDMLVLSIARGKIVARRRRS